MLEEKKDGIVSRLSCAFQSVCLLTCSMQYTGIYLQKCTSEVLLTVQYGMHERQPDVVA
jgi:hypothetical protein